jgi:hypothetical protein
MSCTAPSAVLAFMVNGGCDACSDTAHKGVDSGPSGVGT